MKWYRLMYYYRRSGSAGNSECTISNSIPELKEIADRLHAHDFTWSWIAKEKRFESSLLPINMNSEYYHRFVIQECDEGDVAYVDPVKEGVDERELINWRAAIHVDRLLHPYNPATKVVFDFGTVDGWLAWSKATGNWFDIEFSPKLECWTVQMSVGDEICAGSGDDLISAFYEMWGQAMVPGPRSNRWK